MAFCQQCGADIADRGSCSNCGSKIESTPRSRSFYFSDPKIIGLGLAFLTVFFLLGNLHIVLGKNFGARLTARESFGFSEMIVNVDTITSIPLIAAVMKYPIGVRVLQRDGYIETFDQINERAVSDAKAMLDAVMRGYQQSISGATNGASEAEKQATREYEESLRQRLRNSKGTTENSE